MKKQNFIVSKIKEELVLGYPNTIDPETNLPLFNCQCSSNFAKGYKIEKEMIQFLEKDNYLRKAPPEIAILQIDAYLKRLLELKNLIISKIKEEEKNNKLNINNIIQKINQKENNLNDNKENQKDNSLENNNKVNNKEKDKKEIEIVQRNYFPQKSKGTKSVLFDFHTKILSKNLANSFVQKKEPSLSLSPSNKDSITEKNIDNEEDYNDKQSLNKFQSFLLKMKKKINEKNRLLLNVQRKSYRFRIKENIELKQIQMKNNRLKSKGQFNDFSTIFSNNQNLNSKTSEKFINDKDNVLDPVLYDIKRKMDYEKKLKDDLIKNQNLYLETNSMSNEKFLKLYNTFFNESNLNNKSNNNSNLINKLIEDDKKSNTLRLNNLKYKNKFSLSHNKKDFNTLYNSNNNINNNINEKSTIYLDKYNISKSLNDIKLSNVKGNFNTNDNQNLNDMFYFNYIFEEFKKKKFGNKNSQTMFIERNKINKNNNISKKFFIPSIENKTIKEYKDVLNNANKTVKTQYTQYTQNNNHENKETKTEYTQYNHNKLRSCSEKFKFPLVDLLSLDKFNEKYNKENNKIKSLSLLKKFK